MHSTSFSVFVDVPRFRQEKAEERFALETTGLCNTKQTEVLNGTLLAERARDLPLDCQMAKRSLRSVVVPWNAVILNEGKKRFLVPLKPLAIPRCRVSQRSLSRDHFTVEAIDPTLVFAKVARLKAKPVNVFENRSEQITDGYDKPLKLLVKWILPKIIVQVPDQMDQAFLLLARKSVVSPIKIGDDGALKLANSGFRNAVSRFARKRKTTRMLSVRTQTY